MMYAKKCVYCKQGTRNSRIRWKSISGLIVNVSENGTVIVKLGENGVKVNETSNNETL